MDLNIGAALWMAAQAEGQVTVVSALKAGTEQPARHQSAKRAAQTASTALPVAESDPDNNKSHIGCSRSSVSHAMSAAQKAQQAGAHELQCHSTCSAVTHASGHGNHTQGSEAQTASMSSDTGPAGTAARSCSGSTLSDNGEQESSRHRNAPVCCGWYKSAARVVLLGHGADEQHAGYGRHRTCFRNQVSLMVVDIANV